MTDCAAAAHRVGPPVEPQAVHLLFGTVAGVTMVTEDRLHVAREVHARVILCGDAHGQRRQSDRKRRETKGVIAARLYGDSGLRTHRD